MKPVHLTLHKPFEKLETGASRFWGNPDLPKDFDYPMYIDDEGDEYPYFFICQINLAELAVSMPTIRCRRADCCRFSEKSTAIWVCLPLPTVSAAASVRQMR